MNDFNSAAYPGSDFVNILFEKVSENIENTVIEIFRDGFKFNTYLCDDSDTSLTIQPLAEGSYTYIVTEIDNGAISKSEGTFIIGNTDESQPTHISNKVPKKVLDEFKDGLQTVCKWGADRTYVMYYTEYIEYIDRVEVSMYYLPEQTRDFLFSSVIIKPPYSAAAFDNIGYGNFKTILSFYLIDGSNYKKEQCNEIIKETPIIRTVQQRNWYH